MGWKDFLKFPGKSRNDVDAEVREKTNKPQERGSSGTRGLGSDKNDTRKRDSDPPSCM